MPLTYLTVGNSYLVAPYSTIFPTTASIGTVSGTSVQITGITGPPNFTYSIIRNGTTIATGQTGSTYTDSTVAGLTTYTYQIVPTNQYSTALPKTIGTTTTPVPVVISVTGGTKVSVPSLGTIIYVFTTSTATTGTTTGTLTISGASVPFRVFAIAGGGAGGGNNAGGGGGAGGLVDTTYTITSNNILTVSVGSGGTGVSAANGNKGIDTTVTFSTSPGGIGNIICNGGGGGLTTATNVSNANGGSGGGGCGPSRPGGTALGTNNNIGFPGGSNDSGYIMGAGGGGAGAKGGDAIRGVSNGAGGAGYSLNITGSALYWAGGGGGGSWLGDNGTSAVGANGGIGGGGAGYGNNSILATPGGSAYNTASYNGGANTGGGGGGGGTAAIAGGAGGSGIVIVSFSSSLIATFNS